ncbi:lysine N(6)-hydroxylase/L-ornithine N(5)-oxygenase family protein [Aureibacter tunicatorum]|uniref:Lysine N6-hydroxylase n=1 Tax=Aureibacter tunicatorum TaxID=866807 RepID=A0AAE3XS78_9BACT|nr:lysine N(6)-hydroxylase/L-ornithine N(5)-oxygenase family protein [Aureibacter tunicatorum]MDR6241020.1 lysine N6-hydroxylase [Aureibacter tunicatorum]BDD03798.1 lysine N6-hydroxylase/L-ornithine N5-oxygenase family protein [Aureibacter tunicatorum]
MNQDNILDFVAIGVGPFNLSLACLTEPVDGLDGVFLDRSESFDWHPGMMLESTTLQIPFMADLVTLADPTSKFSFLNYIKQKGRIYSFYIKESFLLMRKEYNQYCQWVIEQLSNVHFNTEVETIEYIEDEKLYVVISRNNATGAVTAYKTKKLVLGTGTGPYVPKSMNPISDNLIHSSQYLYHKEEIQEKKRISVVGSGQSAAEIFYDLLQEIDTKEYALSWVTRSPRYFPLEYSKLTLEMTSPEYVDYFYNLPSEKRDELIANQKHLYKGINQDLIAEIFDLLYIKRLSSDYEVNLRTNSEVVNSYVGDDRSLNLEVHQTEQDKYYLHKTDFVIAATGYGYRQPEFIESIASRIKWDEKNRYDVSRNYTIDINNSEIYVQNAELHTHGFVTPDLGMVCYRNSYIINELMGREVYPVESRIAFQQFEVSPEEEIVPQLEIQ